VTRPADTPIIDFEIDHDASPGDLVGALAALLIEAVEAEGADGGEGKPDGL